MAALSDLNDKQVVIAGLTSISPAAIKAAFTAAGAGAADLKEGTRADADSQLAGNVAAAIIAFVPTSTAMQFPELPGLKLLRVKVEGATKP